MKNQVVWINNNSSCHIGVHGEITAVVIYGVHGEITAVVIYGVYGEITAVVI